MQIEEYIEEEAKLAKLLKTFDEDSIRPLFDAVLKHGKIKTIYWTQYAPSFNDGDPCYFSVNEPEMVTEDSLDDDDKKALAEAIEDECEEDFWAEYEGPSFAYVMSGVPREAIARLKKFFRAEDLCETVFGDGTRIVATWNPQEQKTVFATSEAGDY